MNNKKSLDTYLGLYAQYYDLEKSAAPEDELTFYFEYATKANGSILEPMCGTGRFLIPMMHKLGLNIEGFDASPFMLEILNRKCEAKGFKPNVWQGFLQDLNLNRKYSLIFIPSGSFGLIIDIEEVKLSLAKILEHLENNGVFVFEVETLNLPPSSNLGIWDGCVQKKTNGEIIISSTLALPPNNQVETMVCRYDLVYKNSIVSTEIENFQVRLYDHNQMYNLLKSIGFSSVKMIKAFDPSKIPDELDAVIIYECRK